MSVKLLLLRTWHVCWVMAAYKTALHIDPSQVVFLLSFKILVTYFNFFTHLLNSVHLYAIWMCNYQFSKWKVELYCWYCDGQPLFYVPKVIYFYCTSTKRLYAGTWLPCTVIQKCMKVLNVYLTHCGQITRFSWHAEWCWECQTPV